MTKIKVIIVLGLFIALTSFKMEVGKLITKTGHISMFSHTVAEDINANNYKVTSSLNTETGAMVFSVPMQGFEFKKALMQKHFNSKKFLNTKEFPKAKFKGMITDMSGIDMSKDGTYPVTVKGDLTMHGVTNTIEEAGEITLANGVVTATSKFNLTLNDYKIAFEKGKPSKNIAKVVELTIKMEYK